MSGPQPSHNRAVTGTLRAGHAPPLRCCYTLLHIRPGGQLAGVDALDLVNGQVVGGVAGVDDDGDAIQRQDGSLGAALDLGVLQLTAGHADGVGALQRTGDAGGGIGSLELQLGVGVDGLVSLDQLLHQRRDGGRTADDDLALGLGGGKVRAVLTDVAVVGSDGLAVLAQAVGDEIDGHGVRRVAVSDDVERTGQNGVVLITLKQGTPGMVIRRGNEVAENAKVQHKSSLDLIKTVYIDGEKVDLGTKTIDDLIPAENIEGIEVKKEAGGKGEIYITTKKTKAVEKTIAKGNMKVEGKVVDEQGEPVIGAAVLIEGTTTGSVTDVNGNFVLSVPSKDAVLVVSYIGMATGKVKVQPKLTITLKSE